MKKDPPRALITGGQGDLAQAIAQRLEKSGWDISCPGRTSLDVASRSSVDAFFSTQKPPFHLVINNAGSLEDAPMARLTESQWDQVIQTHLTGSYRVIRACLPGMFASGGGHFLQIGSFSALSPPVGQANYASAKAGLIALTTSLAREYGARNIRANCILPGFLETRMTAKLSPQRREQIRSQHVLGRFNTPSQVALFVECVHQMEHVSGQLFQIDSRISPWI